MLAGSVTGGGGGEGMARLGNNAISGSLEYLRHVTPRVITWQKVAQCLVTWFLSAGRVERGGRGVQVDECSLHATDGLVYNGLFRYQRNKSYCNCVYGSKL